MGTDEGQGHATQTIELPLADFGRNLIEAERRMKTARERADKIGGEVSERLKEIGFLRESEIEEYYSDESDGSDAGREQSESLDYIYGQLRQGSVTPGDPRTKGLEQSDLVWRMRSAVAMAAAMEVLHGEITRRIARTEFKGVVPGAHPHRELFVAVDGTKDEVRDYYVAEFVLDESPPDADSQHRRTRWVVKLFESDSKGNVDPDAAPLVELTGRATREVITGAIGELWLKDAPDVIVDG